MRAQLLNLSEDSAHGCEPPEFQAQRQQLRGSVVRRAYGLCQGDSSVVAVE